MIVVSDKSQCTGCTACVSVCPAQCIVMRRDREGFDYPVANADLCVGCGRCEEVCPMKGVRERCEPWDVFAARAVGDSGQSSSGGVFPVLAEDVVSRGGVVYGAKMNPDLTVGHAEADSVMSLKALYGSKYVQSDLYSTFQEAEDALKSGREVLFAGTPCQIAGLKAFLAREYDSLLTVDFACHGVPSPGLWERYVEEVGRRCGYRPSEVRFRDKRRSWRHYDVVYASVNGETVVPAVKDPYMALFFSDMSLRPSCYRCRFKSGRGAADITLGDLWNVGKAAPVFDDDRGASVVLLNTDAGRRAYERVKKGVLSVPVQYADAVLHNGGFSDEVECDEDARRRFFAGLDAAGRNDLYRYMRSFVKRPPVLREACRALRSIASRVLKLMSR